MWYSSSTGRIELQMTLEQAKSASHQGQCYDDVVALIPKLKRQLDKIKPDILAAELSEYGAWDETELKDHRANLERVVWLAAGDIIEENYNKRGE